MAGSPTATQIISWTEDPNLPAGLDYVVVTRKNVAGSQRVLSMPVCKTRCQQLFLSGTVSIIIFVMPTGHEFAIHVRHISPRSSHDNQLLH